MKRTIPTESKITLTVRTADGVVSLDMGLSGLSREECKFLFTCVRMVREGGSINFGLAPAADNVMELTFRLLEPKASTEAQIATLQ